MQIDWSVGYKLFQNDWLKMIYSLFSVSIWKKWTLLMPLSSGVNWSLGFQVKEEKKKVPQNLFRWKIFMVLWLNSILHLFFFFSLFLELSSWVYFCRKTVFKNPSYLAPKCFDFFGISFFLRIIEEGIWVCYYGRGR